MDEDFVFKVSLVLLCFSLLLSIIVLFLIFWLAKIHHQVDSISNAWSVYCRLTPNQKKATTTENQPEDQDTCSPLPLVFFNQQAAGSDTVNSWKHINRAFAYASVRSDVDSPLPKTEETHVASQVEDNKPDEDCKTQKEIVQISDVPATSYLQIVDNHSSIVAISTNECPAKDVKHGIRKIHVSVSSADEDDNYTKPLKDCTQVELETMRFVNEEDFVSCSKNQANGQHISFNINNHSGVTEGSDTDKSESTVWMEENREESPEFCNELHNLTSTECDEQNNEKSSQEMETENKADGRIMDGTKLPNENDHGYVAVFHSDESLALPEDSKKAMPCPGGESERVTYTKTRPKGKRRRKKKSFTDGIHSDGKNGSETRKGGTEMQKGVVPLDDVNEDKSGFLSTQSVEQMEKTGLGSAIDFQQTQQHSGEKVKGSGYSDYEESNDSGYQIVVKNVGTNVSLPHQYHAASISESDGKVKPEDGKQEKYNDDYATNECATERNGSSGIVSQLRDLFEMKLLTDSAHSVDRESKITVEAGTTESFSKDGYISVMQENVVPEKYAVEEYCSTATDLEDRQSTAEQIYSHVDDKNDDLYCEIPSAAQPGLIYVNHDDNQNVGDGYSDEFAIYSNNAIDV